MPYEWMSEECLKFDSKEELRLLCQHVNDHNTVSIELTQVISNKQKLFKVVNIWDPKWIINKNIL